MRLASIGLCALLAGGCGSQVRYADREVLWRDPDTAPIPVPRVRRVAESWMYARAGIFEPIDRALSLRSRTEAGNVNALDEVPDSSWFEDPRRRARALGIAFGPAEVGADPEARPDPDGPITIVTGKVRGASRGLVVSDSRGQRFLFKLDPPRHLGLTTSTEVVCARLVAAAGWRVPAISLVEVPVDRLVLSPASELRDALGDRRRFTQEDLRRFLADIPRTDEGRYRFLASAWIEGELVGPYAYLGHRADDPNDRVPHEDRRELRGYRVFSSWINNVDTIESNTLDAYVGAPGAGHLVHYQQDVGGSFGNYAVGPLQAWMSYESYSSGARILGSLFALGGYTRAWARAGIEQEHEEVVATWPELGWFEASHFDPRSWSPLWSNPAFQRATRRDLYWGAKQVLAFTAEELRAAIAVGRYRPAAARRLFDVLWQRRDKIGRAYLSLVAPFEQVRFEGDSLCFDDLMVQHGFETRPARYEARGAGPVAPRAGPRRCAALARAEGYHVVTLRVRRAGERRFGPVLRVHYVEERGARRLVGLER